MLSGVQGLAAEFLKYDVRACKYEQLCAARSEPKTSNLQFFNSLFEHAEVVTHLLENSRGLVLLRACEALEAVVSSNPTPEVLDQVSMIEYCSTRYRVVVLSRGAGSEVQDNGFIN